MKTERLVSVILYLLAKRQCTAQELADKFEVSVRTIYRDMEDINMAGIPVVVTQGRGGGFRIMDGFALEKSLFSQTDVVNLLRALNGIQSTGIIGKELANTLAKVQGLLSEGLEDNVQERTDQLVLDFSGWDSREEYRDTTRRLKEGIEKKEILRIVYHKPDAPQEEERLIEPYSLLLKGYSWYLHAYCYNRKAFRSFKVSRILRLEGTGEYFQPRSERPRTFYAERWEMPPVDLVLRLPLAQKNRIAEYCGFGNITDTDDGYCVAKLSFPLNGWVYQFILSFGPGCEVLEPEGFREEIVEMVREMAGVYGLVNTDRSHNGRRDS